ncbi:tRNA uracil 4-sulfurtransferase ThiI [Entomospira culicis]|uniref:Probable tRNA sulfurtransferase n=1 Tax=Entomospira culicis TaxID=2719989 RepID=A0A968GF15_9SPIO|nr:tRNA uracil 4-sulfurtransferase ThiI [Entomospira culicis]NIZ18857.1 tRNA 4-thiouridine(8) synthase ThiI [Entomospira culicis]NIZ69072.1 tRNA 4-thiouridine(8) synthase ThiI [Entomospira culicis]WDI37659.1 tRNA 4-thiouridine(8) synthase ThiI [Entomospira culicis]WDI39287.1 tRNA 4-thiouridine(8) synthase ThiI [Entomospira culicis]
MELFLLRAGEYMLKKGSRPLFEKQMQANLKRSLKPYLQRIIMRDGRIYLQCVEGQRKAVSQILNKTFGIADFHWAKESPLVLNEIKSTLQALLETEGVSDALRFKVDVKRPNKSFPMQSYDLSVALGGWLLDLYPQWKVDLHQPELTVKVEIRERVYLYLIKHKERNGAGGLPVGAVGRGVLMLSGGIDSPVAGYMMNKRGMNLVAVHFHTPPYTGEEALQKVEQLAQALAPWNSGKLSLYTINFTEIQLKINQLPKAEFATIVGRILMMKIARLIMLKEDARAIITGEALAQVASQTLESLQVTDALSPALVLRPCVGMDKQEIIEIAQTMKTFATSIIPAADCCSLFAPDRPATRPKIEEVADLITQLAAEDLIEKAFSQAKIVTYPQREA